MIGLEDITKGIANSILYEFKDATISDDPYAHISGPAFIVKMVTASPEKFSATHAHRLYHFDVVYFAEMDTPIHTLDVIGQKLLEAFIWPVEFAGRYIQPQNLSSVKVDRDFHVEFDLDFFDEIEPRVHYKTMQELGINFRVELDLKKE